MFKSLKFLLHYCWKFKKSYVFYVFAYQVVYALIPLVAVIFPKFIIDELMGEQRGSYLFVFTIILIGVNMFGNMLAAFFRGRSLICKGEVFNKFQIMVAEKLADCDFERLESSEFLDTKERAKKFIFANGQGFGVVLDSAVNIIGKIFVFAGLIAIIATFRIWIVLIFIGLILLNAVMEGRVRKRTVEWQMEQVPIERRTAYLLGIIEDPSYGKEMCIRDSNMAAQMIQAGDADIVVAGGMENMSMAPYALKNARYGYRMGNAPMVDTMVNDALWDAFNDYHMGITAENVAEQWGLTREQLDEFAAASQQKACAAIEAGRFKDEIVPVEIKKKKETVVFDTDEGPRPGTTAEGIAKLRPAFKKDGIVTAANASSINDGAAAIVVMSEEKAKELGVTPMATWVGGALAGVDPTIMGVGPVAATKKVMAKTGLSVADMDLIEANEAFAAQSLAVAKDLEFDMSKVNVNGGAIALGHPVGASGCRILVTLLHEMQKKDAKKGLATLCIGGGMGCATIVER